MDEFGTLSTVKCFCKKFSSHRFDVLDMDGPTNSLQESRVFLTFFENQPKDYHRSLHN